MKRFLSIIMAVMLTAAVFSACGESSNGKEFEPDEGSSISVCFNSKAIADAIKDEDVSLEAEHIADDGKTESIALTSAAGGEAVFEAESFSIYVIKYHEDDTVETETERIIYHFLSPNYFPVEENGNTVYKVGEYRFPNKHNDLVSPAIWRAITIRWKETGFMWTVLRRSFCRLRATSR